MNCPVPPTFIFIPHKVHNEKFSPFYYFLTLRGPRTDFWLQRPSNTVNLLSVGVSFVKKYKRSPKLHFFWFLTHDSPKTATFYYLNWNNQSRISLYGQWNLICCPFLYLEALCVENPTLTRFDQFNPCRTPKTTCLNKRRLEGVRLGHKLSIDT